MPTLKRLGLRWRSIALGLFLGAITWWSSRVSEVSPGKLFDDDGWQSAKELLTGFANPDVSDDFIERVVDLMAESFAIGMLGMVLAVIIAVPLAVLGARYPDLDDAPSGRRSVRVALAGFRWVIRGILAILRSIPEIIWAFLFVRILGLGPGPAVLAIGVTFGGIIGKLYADLIEACDPMPIRALRASGIGPLGVLMYGVIPQVRNQWIGYALFRFECSVRSASVLGMVGAGGIGAEIDLSIRYFQYDKLATSLFAILVCIIALEALSVLLRRLSSIWTFAIAAIGTAYGLNLLDVPWNDLFSAQAIEQASRFLDGFTSPNTDFAFVSDAFWLMLETVGMALLGTLCAAAIAFVLAPMATRMLTVRGFLRDAPTGRGLGQSLVWLVFLAIRLILQVFRAMPELVFAVVFVVWVGPGPFAGVLAITAHTIGVLGRLFCDVYEEVEPDPARALERIGVGSLGRWRYGVLPQVQARLAAYALFRFEVNVRATAMMGFVGGGGIGDAIHSAISLFHMDDLATLIIILLLTVFVIDAIGGWVRHKVLTLGHTSLAPAIAPPHADAEVTITAA